jgi:hypothetical protein
MFRFITTVLVFSAVAASLSTSAQAPEALSDPAPTGFIMFVEIH